MLYQFQTLRHRSTNELARLAPDPQSLSAWAWDISKNTRFVKEDGTIFFDDIAHYTHIEDEFGRPYSNPPTKGRFVDESAKKYLVDKKTLLKMRRKGLLEWEQRVLDRMDGKIKYDCDIPNKFVHCPFADGSYCHMAYHFFMKRRNPKPLYKIYDRWHRKGWRDMNLIIQYKGQTWLDGDSALSVIKLRKN